MAANGIFQPGQWVRFKCMAFIETDHIIIHGMLGEVVDHPHARFICTPGVSSMIRIAGSDLDYGYFNDWFVPISGVPDEEALAESAYLWNNAFTILEQVYGYTGFIQIGGKVIPQEKLLQEITATSERIGKWERQGRKEQEIAGNLKRIRKVLRAFNNHPDGEEALKLALIIEKLPDGASARDAMISLRKWAARAVNRERLEMQSERVNGARKKGNADNISFK